MKVLACHFRKLTVAVSIAALMLFIPGIKTSASVLGKASADKKVDITVVIHGQISGFTVKKIEELVEDWLEVAHFAVVNADGVDILELEVEISVDDDGEGFHIHTECGEWDEDQDADTVDAIDDVLHEMIEDFIEKYVR